MQNLEELSLINNIKPRIIGSGRVGFRHLKNIYFVIFVHSFLKY